MHKVILTMLALISSYVGRAQDADYYNDSKKAVITAGTPYKDDMTPVDMWCNGSGGYYMRQLKYGESRNYLVMSRYTHELTLDFQTEFDLSSLEKNRKFNGILDLGDKLILFTSQKDKKNTTKTFYWNEIDRETLVPNPTSHKIGELQVKSHYYFSYYDINFEFSPDSSKILIQHGLEFIPGKPTQFALHVFSRSFDPLWSKTVTLPDNFKVAFDLNWFKITNDGVVVAAGYDFKDKKDWVKNGKNYQSIILTYEDNGNTSNEYVINLDGKFVADMNIELFNDAVIFAGFYKNTKEKGLNGTFHVKLDLKSKKIIHERLHPFSNEFIRADMPEKEQLKASDALVEEEGFSKFYLFKDFILFEDGGVALISEFTLNVKYKTQTTSGTDYIFGDIVLVKFDIDGELLWISKIDKHQGTHNDSGERSSYVSVVVNDNIYLIFNDNPKNVGFNQASGAQPIDLKDAFASLVTVDADGQITREALMSTKNDKVTISPINCAQVSHDTVILFARKGRDKLLYEVKFKTE